MIHPPYPFRCPDDDSGAPVDYSYVSSVSEGRRRLSRKTSMTRTSRPRPGLSSRHRPTPTTGNGWTLTAPVRPCASRIGAVRCRCCPPRRKKPSRRTLRPPRRPPPQSPQQEAQPQVIVTEDGSQFDPPAMAKLPEWYRVAQQNASTTDDPDAPRPQGAGRAPGGNARGGRAAVQYDPLGRPIARRTEPRQERRFQGAADRYAEAGYPPELLQEQRELDEKQEVISRRRRHGAQQAVSERRQEEYRRSLSGEPAATGDPIPPAGRNTPTAAS